VCLYFPFAVVSLDPKPEILTACLFCDMPVVFLNLDYLSLMCENFKFQTLKKKVKTGNLGFRPV